MAPAPQAVCLQPRILEQRVLAGTDVGVNMPAAVSSLLLRTWISVITSLDHFITLNVSSNMHFIEFRCFMSSYLNGFIPAILPYYSRVCCQYPCFCSIKRGQHIMVCAV
jgi:hypothetical protein